MMAETRKNTLNDLDAMFEKTRTISDFIEKHCSQKVKFLFSDDLTDEQFEAVLDDDDVPIIGFNGPEDSIDAVRDVGSPLHLNFFGDPIEGIVLDDGTVWFDPDDLQYRRDPLTRILKDVEGARRKLEEMKGAADYVQTFGDGKTLISLDGLQELAKATGTKVDGWRVRLFSSWCDSVIPFWTDSVFGKRLTFSVSWSNS